MKIIKIGAIWCPGCLVMKKVWKNIMTDYENINIIEYDYDMDTEIVSKYKIGDILPVVIVMNNNQELTRIIGEKSKKELNKIFKDIGV